MRETEGRRERIWEIKCSFFLDVGVLELDTRFEELKMCLAPTKHDRTDDDGISRKAEGKCSLLFRALLPGVNYCPADVPQRGFNPLQGFCTQEKCNTKQTSGNIQDTMRQTQC